MKSDANPYVFAGLFAAGILAYAAVPTEHSSVLWEIVRNRCAAPSEGARQNRQCDYVDSVHKYAVLKDRVGKLQYLLIPTERITGIESPAILAPDAENYWQHAWLARRFLEQRAEKPVPRDYIALAINSSSARSQNQLHIHIDCVRPDVKEALSRSEMEIGAQWTPFGTPLRGHHYLAKRLEAEDLSGVNPFKDLAEGIPSAAADMKGQSLVVVGASFADDKKGFYFLNGHIDLAADDLGSGEELIDQSCTLLGGTG